MMEHYRRPPSRSSGDPARSSSDSRPVKDGQRGSSRERSPAPSRTGQSSSAKADRSRSRSREPSMSRDARDGAVAPKPAAVGARFNDIVREGSDGETFWYVNNRGERASVVYSYSQLEKLTGKSRKELNYPVVCSKRRSRGTTPPSIPRPGPPTRRRSAPRRRGGGPRPPPSPASRASRPSSSARADGRGPTSRPAARGADQARRRRPPAAR